MFRKFSYLKIVLLSLILFLITEADVYTMQVNFYIGKVSLIRNNRKSKLSMGAYLHSGDIIKTGRRSQVILTYKDRSRITIMENSTARIGSKNIKGSDDVALISGNISGKFTKLAKGRRSRRVYGPTVVCAIRGTEFKMGVSKGGDSRVDLKEGKLDVKNPYGRTDLRSNQNIEAGVGNKPVRTKGSLSSWKTKKDKELERNPGEKGEQYRSYMKKFDDRNKNESKNMGKYNTMVKSAGNKDDIKKAGEKINSAEERIQDDLMLNEAANSSIEGVMNDYKNRKNNIYNLFYKIKEESNKVLEQQRRNYEAIQAVKEEYRKAYEKIMGKYLKDKKKILGDINMDNIKPKIKKY